MTNEHFPKRARTTAWNEFDQIGRLMTDDGEELKVGRSACADFVPGVNTECWVHEVRADRVGPTRRATMVSLTSAPPPSREVAAAEARAKLDAKKAEPLVAVFVPPLLELLFLAERELGRPLVEAEVWALRDKANCVALGESAAKALFAKRGHADIDPENAWQKWQIVRRAAP
jgi:hypothetical protein